MKNALLIASIIGITNSFGQGLNTNDSINFKNEETKQINTFYMEGFGNGIYGSFNYDRIIKQEKKYKTSARFGFLFIPSNQATIFSIPVEYSYLKGIKNHYLELGGGISYVAFTSKSTRVVDGTTIIYKDKVTHSLMSLTGRIGYRFQKAEGGLFFKIGVTPLIPLFIKNSYGIVGSGESYSYIEYFPISDNFPVPVIPLAGIGIGYTLRK